MGWLQRLFTGLAGLLSAAYGIALLAAAAGWLPGEWLIRPLDFLLAAWRVHLWAVGFVSLGVGLAALVGTGGRDGRDRPVVRETELGKVAISRRAVERLVETAARRIHGVRKVGVDLDQGDKGLTVSLTLEVAPDVPLHAVSHEVQAGVESYLKETSDLTAHRVNVEIRQVSDAGPDRGKEMVRHNS